MKIAPILRAIEKAPRIEGILVHTGQHYDHNMSQTFFKSLGIRTPKHNLEVGSGSHAIQTGNIMIRFEKVCLKEKPDLVLVVGDVNSTIAAGLVAKKLHIDLAHVEAGLRSRDRTMPEEINRIATDSISDLFFTTEPEGTHNLISEGNKPEAIFFVGNVMVDNLYYELGKIKNNAPSAFAENIKRKLPEKYFCMTLHRPSNVDNKNTLSRLLNAVHKLADEVPVVFPCHPRTRKNIEAFSLSSIFRAMTNDSGTLRSGFILAEPMDYVDFLYLWKDSCCLLTDSGGLQAETTALKIPCITMRDTTECPITIEQGSNVLAGMNEDLIVSLGKQAICGGWKKCSVPDLWDGKASERIVDILNNKYGVSSIDTVA